MATLAPSLDALFEADGIVIVPGLLRGLGIRVTRPEPDETVESYETYLEQLSQEAQ